MTPLSFQPLLKRIRWGGTRLGAILDKPVGVEADYAESWELSDYGNDQSVVADGEWQGLTLNDLIRDHNHELFGRHAGFHQFPLLLKFLDCSDILSVQVHPDDSQAKQLHPDARGKTEAWIVIDCHPGSRVFAGLKNGVTRTDLEQHLSDGTVEGCLHSILVKPGDCIFIPAGTVHAIGGGILMAEVQQTSNITFRLHDWGRLGADGEPRELHIEQSLDCTDFSRGPIDPVEPLAIRDTDSNQTEELVSCPYFTLHRHSVSTAFQLTQMDRFHALMVLDGTGRIEHAGGSRPLSKGQTVLIPAACCEFTITTTGNLTLLDAFLPDSAPV
ncbi:MAG: type I phosphomannose isomerase catalytic subunit [Planctomycetota bacterium]|jgi:mannose-6-phosphate isomerase